MLGKINKFKIQISRLLVLVFCFSLLSPTIAKATSSNYAEVYHKYLMEDGSNAKGIPSSAPQIKTYAWDKDLGDTYWQKIDIYHDNPDIEFVRIEGSCAVKNAEDKGHRYININPKMNATKTIVKHIYKYSNNPKQSTAYYKFKFSVDDGSTLVGMDSELQYSSTIFGNEQWVTYKNPNIPTRYKISGMSSTNSSVNMGENQVLLRPTHTSSSPAIIKVTLKDVGVATDNSMAHVNMKYIDDNTGKVINNMPTQVAQVPLTNPKGESYEVSIKPFTGYQVCAISVDGVRKTLIANTSTYKTTVGPRHTKDKPLDVIIYYTKQDSSTTKVITYETKEAADGTKNNRVVTTNSVKTGTDITSKPLNYESVGYTHTSTEGTEFKNGTYTGKLTNLNAKNNYTVKATGDEYKITHYYKLNKLKEGITNLVIVDNYIVNGQIYRDDQGHDYFGRTNLMNIKSDKNGSVQVTTESPSGGKLPSGKDLDNLLSVVLENGDGSPLPAWTGATEREKLRKTASPQSATINTARQTWYIHYFWDCTEALGVPVDPKPEDKPPTGGGGSGQIVFTPNSTPWTNTGKKGEGSGAYPVNVKYVGENPIVQEFEVKKWIPRRCSGKGENRSCSGGYYTYSTGTKTSKIKTISVSVKNSTIDKSTINGASGNINITKEAKGITLSGVGSWESKVRIPSGYSGSAPSDPPKPTGNSGTYDIDWTQFKIGITTATQKWFKSHSPKDGYPFSVTVTGDDGILSGYNSSTSNIIVKDGSHYNRSETWKQYQEGGLKHTQTVKFKDGMYTVTSNQNDRAGNNHEYTQGTFYFDATPPEQSFDMSKRIFSDKTGARRGNSVFGKNFAYFGKLNFSDNLSGVVDVTYGWSFGTDKSNVKYHSLYSHGTEYKDRYAEKHSKEIEKPVGDNMYLHVTVTDTAGNQTYKMYGPYDDEIRLKNFRVTDIKDPIWQPVFRNKDGSHNGTYFKANQLPIDGKNHPTYKNALMKKGYAFYFDITSEFLYRDKDRIEIIPTFYHYDGKGGVQQVDAWYPSENNRIIKIGTQEDLSKLYLDHPKNKQFIGSHSKLTLTADERKFNGRPWRNGWYPKNSGDVQYVDGKEQYWYGKYFIPAQTRFYKLGSTPSPSNQLTGGFVVIKFDIKGFSNGVESNCPSQTFLYNPTQWKQEGNPKPMNNPLIQYQNGMVIDMWTNKSVLDDYDSDTTN